MRPDSGERLGSQYSQYSQQGGAGNRLTGKDQNTKPPFVVFAYFHGVNSPITADFRLPSEGWGEVPPITDPVLWGGVLAVPMASTSITSFQKKYSQNLNHFQLHWVHRDE